MTKIFENTLRNIYESTITPLLNTLIYPFIIIKFTLDKKYLPLTSRHKVLYFIIHKYMFRKLLRFPNLIKCNDFNDKIQWLKLFDQDKLEIICSDKLKVREFVCERVGSDYLVPLYQEVSSFDDLDFDLLPKSFVMKTNHDSGTVILVKDKKLLNKRLLKSKLEKSLSRKYGISVGEWAYQCIDPKIIVEYYIDKDKNSTPPDYKFYCIEGVVKFCHFIYDRDTKVKEQLLDIYGKSIGIPLHPKFPLGNDFKKPKKWDEMINISEKISKGFKCVRVDLFLSNNNIYLGEMTFWPMAGTYRGNGQKFYSKFLDFDRTTFKNPVTDCN